MYVASREVRPNECRTIKCLSIHSGDRTNVYILHLIHSYLFEHVKSCVITRATKAMAYKAEKFNQKWFKSWF